MKLSFLEEMHVRIGTMGACESKGRKAGQVVGLSNDAMKNDTHW